MGANRSGLRAIRGPVMLITVGLLFVLNNFTQYGFEQTWPILIIVAGLVSLVGRAFDPPLPPAPPMPPPPPPPVYGSYRQTPYVQTVPPVQTGGNDPQSNPGGGV